MEHRAQYSRLRHGEPEGIIYSLFGTTENKRCKGSVGFERSGSKGPSIWWEGCCIDLIAVALECLFPGLGSGIPESHSVRTVSW